MGKRCAHQGEFHVKTKVTSLTNVQRFILEIAVRCADCKQEFQFMGLNRGKIALDGACVSPNGGIARLSIVPAFEALPPLDDMPIANLPEYVPDSIAGPDSGPMGGGYLGEDDDGEPEPPAPTDFTVVE